MNENNEIYESNGTKEWINEWNEMKWHEWMIEWMNDWMNDRTNDWNDEWMTESIH